MRSTRSEHVGAMDSIWLFEVINDNSIIRLELRLLDEKGWVPMRCERGVCFQTR